MLGLITGASSGLGYDMAIELAKKKIDLVIVARRENKLLELKNKLEKEYNIQVFVEAVDISIIENIEFLVKKYPNIDVLINNAGFGLCGNFSELDLNKELEMIQLNVAALHIFTKKYVNLFKEKNCGYIMNVASIAAFTPGPKMATYYASKAYVLHLTEAIRYELKMEHSNVKICSLCPGPTKTVFDKVAGADFGVSLVESSLVAKYAINQMFKGKSVIIPTLKIKLGKVAMSFIPKSIALKFLYKLQLKRESRM